MKSPTCTPMNLHQLRRVRNHTPTGSLPKLGSKRTNLQKPNAESQKERRSQPSHPSQHQKLWSHSCLPGRSAGSPTRMPSMTSSRLIKIWCPQSKGCTLSSTSNKHELERQKYHQALMNSNQHFNELRRIPSWRWIHTIKPLRTYAQIPEVPLIFHLGKFNPLISQPSPWTKQLRWNQSTLVRICSHLLRLLPLKPKPKPSTHATSTATPAIMPRIRTTTREV